MPIDTEFKKLTLKDYVKTNNKEKIEKIENTIFNYFFYDIKPNDNTALSIINLLKQNQRVLINILAKIQLKKGHGVVMDLEAIENKTTKDHDLTIMSVYDSIANKFYFTIEETIENLNNKLLVTFNETYDVKVFMKELVKRGYILLNEERLLETKSKKILTRYSVQKNGKIISFISYDLMQMFPHTSLYTLSKILKRYLEENPLEMCSLPQTIQGIFAQYGIEKGIEIDNLYFKSEDELKNYLLSKNIEKYYETKEYKIYNLKDTAITTAMYMLYNRIYQKVLKVSSISRNKFTLPSLAYQTIIVKSCLKKKKFPLVLKSFKRSYKGGLTYFENGIYENEIEIYDINSSYPTSMNITGINVFNPIYEYDMELFDATKLKLSEKYIEECNKVQLQYVKDLVARNYRIEDLRIIKRYPNLQTLLEYALNGYCSVVFQGTIEYIDENSLGFNVRLKRNSGNLVGKIDLNKLLQLKIVSESVFKNITYHVLDTYVNALDVIRCNIEMKINKIYVILNNNNKLRSLIVNIYNERRKLKEENNPFEEILKLIMNSSYGKLGATINEAMKINFIDLPFTSPENLINTNLFSLELITKIIEAIKIKSSNIQITPYLKLQRYNSSKENKTKYKLVYKEDNSEYQHRGYNYILAGTITAYSRLLLEAYIKELNKRGYYNIYNDTDSLAVIKLNNAQSLDDLTGKELGKIKLDKKVNKIIILGRKFYSYVINNKQLLKAKGLKLAEKSDIEKVYDFLNNVFKNTKQKLKLNVIKTGELGRSVFTIEQKEIAYPEPIANKKTTIDQIIEYYQTED